MHVCDVLILLARPPDLIDYILRRTTVSSKGRHHFLRGIPSMSVRMLPFPTAGPTNTLGTFQRPSLIAEMISYCLITC
jgi:hypothetical protein